MPRAVIFEAYGPPEVLKMAEKPRPNPKEGEVLVNVEAAGVQPFDTAYRSGALRQWAPAKFPQSLGLEFAGTIGETGGKVAGFDTGDAILGWSLDGAYAEMIVVPAGQFVRKPDAMSWPEAGALSASGQAASTALDALALRAGQTLIVHAAAGGVGSFAVQIAAAHGVRVIGTASPDNHAYLRELGAIPVDYHGDLEGNLRRAAPEGIDAALIAVGGEEPIRTSVALTSDAARVVTLAFDPASERYGVKRIGTQRSTERLASLVALYEAGKLRVPVGRVFALEAAADAHRHVETGHSRGKTVLVMQ
ncbi:NADP-dependent oxidoreductase [Dyella flagellata]|uniref:Oxidoreductase n=1 Tax=Dyella flagellata TaxID=1867833 RepID=A0ABQ5XD67_9GAMM|nr:NADP-dependent oxidoreductase [Dyella flagellata]GLQ89033.1 oxidoreductase [Dyella flagellata]